MQSAESLKADPGVHLIGVMLGLFLPAFAHATTVITNTLSLQAPSGYFVSAAGGGGANVTIDRTAAYGWETFTLTDLSQSALTSGDQVLIQASNGQYFSAACGGGAPDPLCGLVYANRLQASTWETFTIVKDGGSATATIQSGDQVSFQSLNGSYCSADVNGGGPGSIMTCQRSRIQAWETFTIRGLPSIPSYIAPSGDGTTVGSWIAGNPVQGKVQQTAACADPNHPENSLYAYGRDLTSVVLNLCWGGSVYEFWFNGHEFENRITNGALFQIDVVQYSDANNTHQVNPTQGGEGDNKRGSPATSYGTLPDGSGIYGGGHPLNFYWNSPSALDNPNPYDASTDYLFTGLTFTGVLKPSYLGNWQATQYISQIYSAQTQNNVLVQIPAMYLRAQYDSLTTYDTVRHQRIDRPLPKAPCGQDGWAIIDSFDHRFTWNQATGFASTCGVIFFTDNHADYDRGYAIGVYSCTPNLGGSATQLSGQDQSCNPADNAVDGHSSTVLWAEHVSSQNFGHGLIAGLNTFATTIITGTSAQDLINQAQYMYDHGVR